MWKIITISLCLIVIISAQSCPNSCSSKGACVSGVCQCVNGWVGADCGVYDVVVLDGVAVQNIQVPTREWRYFHIDVPRKSTVVTHTYQTSVGGDFDVYVRVGDRPTKDLYLQRDTTSNRNTTITSQNVNGTFYVGLYGYITATGSVKVTLKTVCPSDCSGAGTCLPNGTCMCMEGHAGVDCSTDVVLLADKQVVNSRVGMGTWKYFQATHQSNLHDIVEFVVHQAAPVPTQDCNLYVKFGSLPSLTSFDFRDVTNAARYKVSISDPKSGKYFAGVYGSRNCDFNITLYLVAPDCPNRCSGTSHGTCDTVSYSCTCNSNFIGPNCNVMVPALAYDTPISGLVGDNAWNYYAFNTYTTGNALVTLRQQEGADADCDLYVARNRYPSFLDYDYRDISFKTNFSVLVVGSGVNLWKIGVHGYSDCSYTLQVSLVRSCLNDCTDSTHGTCVDGTCSCRTGWSGLDCSVAMGALVNGNDALGSLTVNGWKYYTYTVNPGTFSTVILRESLSTGNLWLFANPSHLSSPSLAQHDFADTEMKSLHSIRLTATTEAVSYIVGVYANALAVPGNSYEYSIVAYQPQFE